MFKGESAMRDAAKIGFGEALSSYRSNGSHDDGQLNRPKADQKCASVLLIQLRQMSGRSTAPREKRKR
jgi:hypothetical protein